MPPYSPVAACAVTEEADKLLIADIMVQACIGVPYSPVVLMW